MENQPLQPAETSARAAEEVGSAPLRQAQRTELVHRTIPSSGRASQTSHGQRTCPNCGSAQPTSSSICSACDTFLPNIQAQPLRCRHCGNQASSNLQLCPGCGRTLTAAPTPFVGWIAPVLLVLLFLFFLQRWGSTSPWEWTQRQATASWTWLTAVGERLDPQITISTMPAAVVENRAEQNAQPRANSIQLAELVPEPSIDDNIRAEGSGGDGTDDSGDVADTSDAGFNSQAVQSAAATATLPALLTLPTPTTAATPAVPATVAPTATEPTAIEPTAIEPTATTRPSATPSATAPRPTATNSVTPRATQAATQRATSLATATPRSIVASPTPAATAVERTLVQGTTGGAGVGAAAAKATVATARTGTILQPTPTAMATATPSPTATVIPSPTATAAPATVYVLKSGDTPSGVAARYGVSVNALLAANGLGLNDARRLRVGQTLIIPSSSAAVPTVPVPPTVQPTATATTAVAAAEQSTTGEPSSTSAATDDQSSAIRLDAPQLRSPESGSFLSCGAENSLIWLPVPFIREDDNYLLHLGFVSGYNTDGAENVTWVLEQLQSANVTIWRMDEGLCSLAPQEYGRQWRWYVEVVETAGDRLQPVSLPSTVWAFNWN